MHDAHLNGSVFRNSSRFALMKNACIGVAWSGCTRPVFFYVGLNALHETSGSRSACCRCWPPPMPFIVFLVAVESSSHTSHSLLELAEISTGRGIGIPNPSFDKTVLHFEDLHFQYHRPQKAKTK